MLATNLHDLFENAFNFSANIPPVFWFVRIHFLFLTTFLGFATLVVLLENLPVFLLSVLVVVVLPSLVTHRLNRLPISHHTL